MDGKKKNFIYFTIPCRLNQTSFQLERKRKGESERERKKKEEGSHFPPSLPSLSFFLPPLFFSTLSLSLLPSTPSCSVFRLSSLREWSTIKDLIKTPEQAKALWQCARPGPARTGSASYSAPEGGCVLGLGEERWGVEGWSGAEGGGGGNTGSREGPAWPGLGSRLLFLARLG